MNGQRVWRRLVGYAKPFQRRIWLALLLLILSTGAELAGPFLAKAAIDNHILGIQRRWYHYDSLPPSALEQGINHVQINDFYLIREDWLPQDQRQGLAALGRENRILPQGTTYYLVDGTIASNQEYTVASPAGDADGRNAVLVTGRGGEEERLAAVRLSRREVMQLYAYDVAPLLWISGGYAALIFLSAALQYFQLLSLQTTAQRIIQSMRMEIFTHLQKLPIAFFDRTPVGQLVSRVSNDTEAVRELYVSVLATFVQNGVFLFGILIALFLLQPALALGFCLILPFIIALVVLYRRYSSRAFAVIRSRLAEMNTTVNEMIQNMAIVQAFRREESAAEEFARHNQGYFQGRMRENVLEAYFLRPAVDVLYYLALTLVIWYFGAASLRGSVSFGVLYAFILYIERFFEPINMIMSRLSQLQQAAASAERVFEVLDTPAVEETGKLPVPRPQGRVVFENVWFAYHEEQYVLKNVSFAAEPGQTVALVGHTGSGKSSIMNLLLGFYGPNRGRITVDGTDIQSMAPGELRKHIGLVLQDPYLFSGDVSFNIRLYNEAISDEAVRRAAEAVKADEFIRRLPGGYSHVIAERGSTLSSGQRQLLSFARALAADPAILILDEATASIDSETESAIREALHVLSQGRTTFMIAHRLSTIQHADLIVVLSRGEIVERGTHEELMKQGGLYQKMYQLQQGQQAGGVDVS
ncbi:ABC transporter ATP-binding protein [Brevibacillus massiliensis]|uniref:ABC transporter ATP-binding protein n=1 Tax=Brevibacillus massiliensis TaxID=1118054 RepID=UPI00037981C3|nr:ABC transporter ATP-binding protein [Brevibacillus massiliensis]